MSPRIQSILKAVELAAECPASHLESVPVIEVFRGQTIWQGVVESFELSGHSRAKKAYGWSMGSGKETRFVTVLEIPPVTSPSTAVRAAIASQAKNK